MATFSINGRVTGYETSGEGTPVLVIHGTTQSRNAWDQVIGAAPAGIKWVKIDLPGSGESSMPDAPMHLDDIVDDAVALMRSLGHESFGVAGYSLGAVCALHAGSRHHANVTSVVSLCGWARTDARMRHTFTLWQKLLAVSPELFMHYALVDGYTAAAVEMIDPMFDGALAMAAAMVAPGSHHHLDLDVRVDIEEELAGITCPVLVIGGIEDRWVDISKSRWIADTIPGATLLELPAGHLVIGEKAAEIAAAVAAHVG